MNKSLPNPIGHTLSLVETTCTGRNPRTDRSEGVVSTKLEDLLSRFGRDHNQLTDLSTETAQNVSTNASTNLVEMVETAPLVEMRAPRHVSARGMLTGWDRPGYQAGPLTRNQRAEILDKYWDSESNHPHVSKIDLYKHMLWDELLAVGCEVPGLGWDQPRDFHVRCPFHMTIVGHRDNTPSLMVYNSTLSFYCFGCGAWGDAGNIRNFRHTGKLGNKSDRP